MDQDKKHLSIVTRHLVSRWLIFVGVILAGLLFAGSFLQGANVSTAAANATEPPAVQQQPAATLADLQIETTVEGPDSSDKVRPGEPLIYTIRYTNNRSTAISGALIKDTLSDETLKGLGRQHFDCTYTSTPSLPESSFTCDATAIGFEMQWSNLTINGNSSGTIVLHTTVYTSPEPSLLIAKPMLLGNSVEISAPGAVGSIDDTSITIVGPLLKLEKVAAPAIVLPGHYLVYTMTASNVVRADSIRATNVVISDVLPERSYFVDATHGGYYDRVNNRVVFQLSEALDPGEKSVVSFRVLVNPNTQSNLSITNAKAEYVIRAQEIKIKDVLGSKSITVKVGKVLQKTAVAATMKGAIPYIFPSEEVTYTITVYNPYTDTLTGIAVTDTLPGNPDPFIYVRMADTNAPPTILEEGRKLAWTLESIPVGGFTTRSFVVRIPRNTIIPDNKTSYDYKNTLDAFHPKVKFFTEKGLATVRVRAALVITKAVSIARPQPGQTIIYTVTLNNQGVYPLYGLRITDTIAIDPDRRSYFLRMLNGPDPLLDYNKNPMVWDGIDLNSRQAAQLIFEVYPDGHWLDKYCNRVDASERGDGTTTPTDIPSITNKACIVIDSPVKLIKTVEPDEIFPGDTVEYTISIYNDTLQDTWTIDRIVDSLPPGFNQVNVGNPAVIELSPPEDILPGSQIDLPFSVVVSPEELNCADLPKTYWNPAKAIAVHFTAPMTITGYNPSALAPLKINPHVVSDLIPQRQAVLPGSYVTYTLSLFNGSSVAAQNATVSVNLPADVIFVKMIGDNDPNVDYVATVEGTLVTWDGVNIAPVSELQIYFQVQIAENASYGVKTPTLQASATGVCFGKLATGDDPLGTGKINVVEEVVILSKKHLMKTVPVDSLVDYTLSIRNIDAYSYRVQLVTDTLPTGFTFVDMLVGPQPVQQIGNQLVWQNVDVGGKATVTWKIRLKSATLFNYYLNYLSAYSRETPIKTTSDSDLKEALDDLRGGVLVYPVLAVIKESGVTETVAGTVVPYTITLINQSDVSYNQVMVTDTLPTGFTFVKVHPGTSAPSFVSSDKAIVSWKGLTLPKSTGKIVLIIDAKIDRSTPPGAYFNNVEASSPTGSIPNIGPTALVSVTPAPLPKASVSMEVRPTVVDQGGVVTYTITLAHSYDAAIGQITITDTLPAGFSYLKTLTGPAPAAEGRQPVWRNLSAGTSCKAGCAILVFEAQVDPNTATGVRYNEVAGQSPQAVFENPDPGAPVTVNPYSPVLPTISIAKQAGITEVVAGGIVPYIIRITNDTGQGVNQISITDTLPAGFTYLQMSNGPEPTVRGGQIVWDDLSLGDSCNGGPCILELAFSTQVLSDTIGDTYYNSITGGSPNANINGEGPTAPVSVQDYDPELPTVKLTKKANIAKVKNGGVVAYTITIAYKDGVDIGSLLVVDTLPTGFEFIEMTNGPAPIVGGVQPVWGNIPAGECDGTTCTATLSFTAQVSPNTPKASYYNSVSGSSSLVNVIGSGPTAKVDVTYQGRLYLPYILR